MVALADGDLRAPLPLWIKLSCDLIDHPLWRDSLSMRLWIYLLTMAKRGANDGTVKFSYPHAIEALTVRGERNKRISPSRKRVRKALQNWVQTGSVHVASGAQARAQGGAQGYIVVTICDWGDWYDRKPAIGHRAGHRVGTEQGTGLGTRRAHLDKSLEIREEEEGASSSNRLAALDPIEGCLAVLKARYRDATAQAYWCGPARREAADLRMRGLIEARQPQTISANFDLWLDEIRKSGKNSIWGFIKRQDASIPDAGEPHWMKPGARV